MKKILYILIALLILLPQVPSGIALLLGIVFALTLGNPFLERTKDLTSRFLAVSVVGLGAGMNLEHVAKVGLQGMSYTFIGITLTLFFGFLLQRLLNTDRDTSLLISVGTAICGGSAIAAVSPVINARSYVVSAALGTVFILNAIGLFIFPTIGHFFQLSEVEFGLWSALAIHDTSSVVGTTLQYGARALEVGTMVKLSRALWIIPVAIAIGVMRRSEKENTYKKPWFILGFISMAALVTFFPALKGVGEGIEALSKRVMVLTLFIIGSNLSKETLVKVGLKPLAYGVILWLLIASGTLVAILQGLIGFQ